MTDINYHSLSEVKTPNSPEGTSAKANPYDSLTPLPAVHRTEHRPNQVVVCHGPDRGNAVGEKKTFKLYWLTCTGNTAYTTN